MQQAIYNITFRQTIPAAAVRPRASHAARTLRWVRRHWDLAGILTLMGSSAAYGVFALAHLGL